MDTIEDVEDDSLYIQFLSLDTTAVFQTGPFLVVAKNPVFLLGKDSLLDTVH